VPVLVTQGRTEPGTGQNLKVAAIAWFVAAIYYFFQYVLRSAPSVMMPQLASAFGINVISVASIVGLFYYGYSPFSLIAGAGMDRLGPRKVIPIGAAVAGLGALLFAAGGSTAGSVGRLLQGAGGVFAPVGAIYIASKYFPPSQAATLIGATQMFGMAGGAAGQFVVGPLIARGVTWDAFWVGMGISGLVIYPKTMPRPNTTTNTASLMAFTLYSRTLSQFCVD
jgi:MFS family permease